MTAMPRLLLLVSFACSALAYEYGPEPRYTGAPGDNPLACSACHSDNKDGGPINAFPGYGIHTTFSGGSSYTPGGPPVTITVSASDPVNKHFGFQMTARLDLDQVNGQAGDFTAGANQIVICDDNSVKIPGRSCPASAPVQFIEHYYPAGSQVSTTAYTFQWTPPAANVGPVHFYVAVNAVNGDLMATGADHTYTASYTLTPALCASGTPSISKVQSAGAYGALASFAAGSWLEIFGSNFASNPVSNYYLWQAIDFNPGAPTSLAGVSARINGKDAFVWLVSSTQLNVQAPADTATGPVSVTVTGCTKTSAPFTVQKDAAAPGLLQFTVNGTNYLAAFHADNTYVGNPGLIPGYTFSPAKPGETITIFGIGFGDVKRNSDGSLIPPGTPGELSTLVNPVAFSFGAAPAAVAYAGLDPGFVGLYQFNVTVPEAPDGDLPVRVTLNGTPLSQNLVLTVHH